MITREDPKKYKTSEDRYENDIGFHIFVNTLCSLDRSGNMGFASITDALRLAEKMRLDEIKWALRMERLNEGR